MESGLRKESPAPALLTKGRHQDSLSEGRQAEVGRTTYDDLYRGDR